MKYATGEFLYHAGEPSGEMYIVVSGIIGLFVDAKDGSMSELARLGPGQIVGDLAFFSGSPRTSHAKALMDCECHKVSYETVRKQFDAAPPWVQAMTRTLANQVQAFSAEIRLLKGPEDAVLLPRLAVARAWAALTFVSLQFGIRDKDRLVIDWPLLRTYANISFREISGTALQLVRIMENLNLAEIRMQKNEPAQLVFFKPDLLIEFLKFYIRAVSKDAPELTKVPELEAETLSVLGDTKLKVTPIHRGQVELDLNAFTKAAEDAGHPEVNALSVDLLYSYGIEVAKESTEKGVKIRYQQVEIQNLVVFWRILKIIQQMNQRTFSGVGPKKSA